MEGMTQAVRRWTSRDLDMFPEDGKRREIIDGELYVSKQPKYEHQMICGRIVGALDRWSLETGLGEASVAPGVVLGENDDVVPDVAWCGRERLAGALDEAGHFRVAPDLVVEVLSPGTRNEERDRVAKLDLYSRRGALEYWIANWPTREVTVYRREQMQLRLIGTLREGDTIESPHLPGFALPIADLFRRAVEL
jgi:Uma2 family endonuclease